MNPDFVKEVSSLLGPLEEPRFCRVCLVAPLWTVYRKGTSLFLKRDKQLWEIEHAVTRGSHSIFYVRHWKKVPGYFDSQITINRESLRAKTVSYWGHVWAEGKILYWLNEGSAEIFSRKDLLDSARPQHRLALRVLLHKIT